MASSLGLDLRPDAAETGWVAWSVARGCLERGLIVNAGARGDSVKLSFPLNVADEDVDAVFAMLADVLNGPH